MFNSVFTKVGKVLLNRFQNTFIVTKIYESLKFRGRFDLSQAEADSNRRRGSDVSIRQDEASVALHTRMMRPRARQATCQHYVTRHCHMSSLHIPWHWHMSWLHMPWHSHMSSLHMPWHCHMWSICAMTLTRHHYICDDKAKCDIYSMTMPHVIIIQWDCHMW
jgi:hypothetical protein